MIDELEDTMSTGGNIVEYHGCDFFPERWFDAVFVLRTDNTILYDRLQQRYRCANYKFNDLVNLTHSHSLSLSLSLSLHVSSMYRGYSGKKLADNVQCEIFQTILEEARENYSDKIVHELSSNLPEDLERNIDTLCQYVVEWTPSQT